MHILGKIRGWSRTAAAAAVIGASAGAAGCSDFLEVTNPGAIEDPALNNSDYIQLMVHGVIGDFQPAFGWAAVWGGVFVDELYNHHSFFEYPQLERREVDRGDGTYAAGIYNGLHRARFQADSAVSRLTGMLADSAGRDLRIARVLAYSGYSWTLLGEQFCESPINASAERLASDALLETAIQRFDGAIKIAEAGKASAGSIANTTERARFIARADTIANFARVGAARAALNLVAYKGDAFKSKALTYASQVVPAYASESSKGFEYRAQYAEGASSSERRRISNPAWEFVSASRWFSLAHTPFEAMTGDPRIPRSATPLSVTGGQKQFVPNSPHAYSTYDGTPVGKPMEQNTTTRLASALEARYIIAEIEGVNAANIAFVNQRRAVGGQAPLAGTASQDEYLAALRDQRARDMYLDSHRLGDLRRYKKQYGIDLFPSGPYPDNPSISYGSQTCWPVPLSEDNR